ncbi:MAG TPA: transglycosylase SLT domain-containing protein, partial [Acidobacteriota bacterium]
MRRDFQRLALLGVVLSGCASSKTQVSVLRFLPTPPVSRPSEPSTAVPLAESAAIIATQPLIDPNLKKILELMDRASLMFDQGERLLREGKIEAGKQRLHDSVELVKNAPFAIPQYPFLERFYLNLRNDAASLERFLTEEQEKNPAVAEDRPEQILEPAAVDALPNINLYQITLDPALVSMVSEDIKKMRFSIPIALNDRVLRMLEYYQNRSRDLMERGLAQSGKYMPLFRRIFEEESVPLELIHAAQVESMYKPLAYSRAHAKGIWQFTRAAAQDYSLRVTPWVDERSDIEKSTRAAARYLKELYRRFGDWQIALGAYNCGPARFERILARHGDISYWEMAEMGLIPSETINHVPSVLATIIIASNPERYGFRVTCAKPLEFERFSVTRSVRLSDIAEACNLSLETLKELNPELTHLATPRDYPEYHLKLPPGASMELVDRMAELPDAPMIRLRRYRVRRGDTIGGIARRFGLSPMELARINHLSMRSKLRRGQGL